MLNMLTFEPLLSPFAACIAADFLLDLFLPLERVGVCIFKFRRSAFERAANARVPAGEHVVQVFPSIRASRAGGGEQAAGKPRDPIVGCVQLDNVKDSDASV